MFVDHLFGCFIDDDVGLDERHRIGVSQIMWESDYPHADSAWPHSREHVAERMRDVPDDEVEQMVATNARAHFCAELNPHLAPGDAAALSRADSTSRRCAGAWRTVVQGNNPRAKPSDSAAARARDNDRMTFWRTERPHRITVALATRPRHNGIDVFAAGPAR